MRVVVARGVLCFFAFLSIGNWRLSKDKAESECAEYAMSLWRPGTRFALSERSGNRDNKCLVRSRNPGSTEDRRTLYLPKVQKKADRNTEFPWRGAFERVLANSLAKWPGIRGLAKAVWLGETEELPEGMVERYREAGLAHLLALSGAHIVSLFLIVRVLLWMSAPILARWVMTRRLFPSLHSWSHLLGAILLAALNPTNEPMVRATVMVVVAHWLHGLRLSVTRSQWVASCAAILLLHSPERAASEGFLLSATATGILFLVLDEVSRERRLFYQYFWVCATMPVLLWPVTAFCFGKVSLLAPVSGLLMSGVWSFVWVPAAFLVLPLVLCLPCERVLVVLEAAWQWFAQWDVVFGVWMTKGYVPVVRPTWIEMGLWVWGFWLVTRCIIRRLNPSVLTPVE
jgi:ComEC/Rec2-related protein